MKTIDLRSDTVTKPSPGMLKAMLQAELGDDVYGEDPTVNQLEALIALMANKEAAIFSPSGTQSNLIGIMSHCGRGDEYIVGQKAHTYILEGGGAAVLGSIQPQPIDFELDGTLPLDKVYLAIKPDDVHYARTRLLCLENTHTGKVLPLDYLKQVKTFCAKHGLASHLDGARVFNAAVKLNVPVTEITNNFDTVSICLSKGLGAPIGSLLCGPKELIAKARRWRKMLGGGMRQAGILAAAGIYALQNNIERLAEDHHNAHTLAHGLAPIDELEVDLASLQTNIIFIKAPKNYAQLREHLYKNGIIIPKQPNKLNNVRLVTHLDVTAEEIKLVIADVKKFFQAVSK